MSNNPLATYAALNPNQSGRHKHSIDTITPHYMAGNCTIETCGAIFVPRSRKASLQYGIGSDGNVGLYVDEANRAWTSSSGANDGRAVTIECVNLADEVNAKLCTGRSFPAAQPAVAKNNTRGGRLDVDGYGGYNTVLDMQRQLGTYEDGVISGQCKGNRDTTGPSAPWSRARVAKRPSKRVAASCSLGKTAG